VGAQTWQGDSPDYPTSDHMQISSVRDLQKEVYNPRMPFKCLENEGEM